MFQSQLVSMIQTSRQKEKEMYSAFLTKKKKPGGNIPNLSEKFSSKLCFLYRAVNSN